VEKEKEKRIPLSWAGGTAFGPPRARARALKRLRPSDGPRARGGRRGYDGDGVAVGPLASERGGEETASLPDGGRTGQVREKRPMAGEA
jgi:hypothetical protein